MALKAGETNTTDALADDLFSAGFDEGLSTESTQSKEPDEKSPEELTTEEAEATRIADEAKAAEEAEATRVADEARAAAEAATAAKPEPVDIKALVAEAIAATKAAEPVKEEPAAPEQTPEEIAAEAQYRKDWPEHAERQDQLKKELAEIKALLATTVENIKGQIAPVIESAHTSAEEKHINTIYGAHADADKIYPDVLKWIDTQPKFLQDAYKQTLEKGSAVSVVELFDTYKTVAGLKATPEEEDPAKKAAEEAAAAEKADRLKRMEGTGTVRTSATAEEDADDFDSAFDIEAKKLVAQK
jgi:hypothetical protein